MHVGVPSLQSTKLNLHVRLNDIWMLNMFSIFNKH